MFNEWRVLKSDILFTLPFVYEKMKKKNKKNSKINKKETWDGITLQLLFFLGIFLSLNNKYNFVWKKKEWNCIASFKNPLDLSVSLTSNTHSQQ